MNNLKPGQQQLPQNVKSIYQEHEKYRSYFSFLKSTLPPTNSTREELNTVVFDLISDLSVSSSVIISLYIFKKCMAYPNMDSNLAMRILKNVPPAESSKLPLNLFEELKSEKAAPLLLISQLIIRKIFSGFSTAKQTRDFALTISGKVPYIMELLPQMALFLVKDQFKCKDDENKWKAKIESAWDCVVDCLCFYFEGKKPQFVYNFGKNFFHKFLLVIDQLEWIKANLKLDVSFSLQYLIFKASGSSGLFASFKGLYKDEKKKNIENLVRETLGSHLQWFSVYEALTGLSHYPLVSHFITSFIQEAFRLKETHRDFVQILHKIFLSLNMNNLVGMLTDDELYFQGASCLSMLITMFADMLKASPQFLAAFYQVGSELQTQSNQSLQNKRKIQYYLVVFELIETRKENFNSPKVSWDDLVVIVRHLEKISGYSVFKASSEYMEFLGYITSTFGLDPEFICEIMDNQVNFIETVLDSDKFKERSGLINIRGKTCYINSTIQCLNVTKGFSEIARLEALFAESQFSKEMCKLFQYLSKSHDGVPYTDMENFKKTLPGHFKDSDDQEDVDEFLRAFFHEILTSFNSNEKKNMFKEMFSEVHTETISCSTCNEKKTKEVEQIGLAVFTPKDLGLSSIGVTISELIEKSLQDEILEGANAYMCEEEKGFKKAVKSISIEHLPQYLVITMNRFEWDMQSLIKKKILTFVEVQEMIDMDKLTGQKDQKFGNYWLYGMIVHRGEALEMGHYIALIRDDENPHSGGTETGKDWLLISDQTIYPLRLKFKSYSSFFKYFLSFFPSDWFLFDLSREFSEYTPYLAFYRRHKDVYLN